LPDDRIGVRTTDATYQGDNRDDLLEKLEHGKPHWRSAMNKTLRFMDIPIPDVISL
jgi:hypothetical protein